MSEAFGFTLERVALQPDWQRAHAGAQASAESVRRARFAREHVRRVVAASLCYELAVHDGCADPEAEYERVFATEFGVDTDRGAAWDRLQAYLEGMPCYPLVYYLAFAIRDRMWQHLVQVGGERWYAAPTAGSSLRSLMTRLPAGPQEWLKQG